MILRVAEECSILILCYVFLLSSLSCSEDCEFIRALSFPPTNEHESAAVSGESFILFVAPRAILGRNYPNRSISCDKIPNRISTAHFT